MTSRTSYDLNFSHYFIERANDLSISIFQALEVIAIGKMQRLDTGLLNFKYRGLIVMVCPKRQTLVDLEKDELVSEKNYCPHSMTDYELAMCA